VTARQSLTTGSLSFGGIGFSTIDASNSAGMRDAARIAIINESTSAVASPTAMAFYTNVGSATQTFPATEQMRLNSTGAVVLKGGSTTASGVGIAFPATQSASSNANTLDDYEEGTWTPEIQIGGSTTGITYAGRGGVYKKIGSQVFCTVQIQLSSKGSLTGDVTLNAFPFTTAGTASSRGGGTFNYFHNTPALTNCGQLFLLVESSDTRSVLRYYNSSTGLSVALSEANINNTTEFFFSFTYNSAS
jgi:hypothetical protein